MWLSTWGPFCGLRAYWRLACMCDLLVPVHPWANMASARGAAVKWRNRVYVFGGSSNDYPLVLPPEILLKS